VNYLLDTNICIYLIKARPREVLEEFEKHSVGEIGISSITMAELQYGAEKSRQRERNRQALEQFLAPLVVAEFDAPAAVAYGQIRALLEGRGTPVGALDTLIAAHALSLDAVLVTNNVREFARVPELQIENWVGE
jgi:tRNA(fMet)-specific endonuclease VapC